MSEGSIESHLLANISEHVGLGDNKGAACGGA